MQKTMTEVLDKYIGDGISVYMDDIIMGHIRYEHDTRLKNVLKALVRMI